MNIKQLYYFVTIVDEGTISKAAKKLFMTQPPLSSQIKSLEDELNCVLFTRTSHGITLTEQGKILYQRAVSVLNLLSTAKETIAGVGEESAGVIRLGVTSSVAATKIMSSIADFSQKNPAVQINMNEADTYTLIEQLRSNEIQFCIIRTPFFLDEKFTSIPIAKGSLVAFGQSDFFRGSLSTEEHGAILLKELSNIPLIVYRRWERIVKSTFEQNGIKYNIRCINNDARTAWFLAQKGMGVALLPSSGIALLDHVTALESECEVREIEGSPWDTDIVILYDRSAYLPACSRKLLQILTTAFIDPKDKSEVLF